MGDGEKARLVAWGREMRAVHDRLRGALRLSQEAVVAGRELPDPGRELLLFCHGFCSALDGHHRGEDALLFPAIEATHADLSVQLRKLEQDHAMIGTLLAGLQSAVSRTASPEVLGQHLDGLAAIMESHFGFEERTLVAILDRLELDATVADVLGPL
ncbi:hemerythrin domain-containing protein [Nocardioides cavernae]|uniref:Hemerythrin domain-containing protein n=1 Tax=Nocardioides cavernae TaxID=1921566 RepID=A0ABR8N723_9ACTN|nr:hemerythrin domain-containing protein [Nocardioides cavernae]MBD3923937.1 hemerythrin domain-containing protein [Nocardioides cavernae]MBM7511127.1 hemerythrin-like domain-containing protein [Nocardioides cavernae]